MKMAFRVSYPLEGRELLILSGRLGEGAANIAREAISQGGDCLHSCIPPPQAVVMTTSHQCKQNRCPSQQAYNIQCVCVQYK